LPFQSTGCLRRKMTRLSGWADRSSRRVGVSTEPVQCEFRYLAQLALRIRPVTRPTVGCYDGGPPAPSSNKIV
jgi:hypothetical protein